jgi:hypothetical protein
MRPPIEEWETFIRGTGASIRPDAFYQMFNYIRRLESAVVEWRDSAEKTDESGVSGRLLDVARLDRAQQALDSIADEVPKQDSSKRKP